MANPFRPTRGVLLFLGTLLVLAGLWLAVAPPAPIRVAASYAAKIVCSGVFVAGRDAARVMREDVREHGHPVMRFMHVTVDREARLVHARFLGFAGGGLALARTGTGCAAVPDGDIEVARTYRHTLAPAPPPRAAPWPDGDAPATTVPSLQALVEDDHLAGPGMRAVVMVRNGRIVAERYGEGFDARAPLAGWSMTKTVTAALVGTLVRQGRVSLAQRALFRAWRDDERAAITLADLMAMSSGLRFDEGYGDVSDVTRMLYLEPDMAGYVARLPAEAAPGTRYSYSSGSSVLLSRAWQEAVRDPARSLQYPREALFAPLGMHTALMEADARGTLVGSSYMMASARDWARFAQFLLDDGTWRGQRLLPDGFVALMRSPAPASAGVYSRAQTWLRGPGGAAAAGYALPADTFWMLGHDGQSIALVPSLRLAIVRLGITPATAGYRPQALLAAAANLLR